MQALAGATSLPTSVHLQLTRKAGILRIAGSSNNEIMFSVGGLAQSLEPVPSPVLA